MTKASTVLPNALIYIASKAAVEQISRVLAKDLGSCGITVNTVSPGPVDTPLRVLQPLLPHLHLLYVLPIVPIRVQAFVFEHLLPVVHVL